MPKMNIKRSIKIDAKPDAVYAKLNDFNHWEPWSPWLIMEHGVKVDVETGGKYYSWDGKRVGSGNMKVLSEKENESIEYDLNFLKPWKSHAKVGFNIKPDGDGSKVTWTMNSSLPFFMFWMKKMMEAFVGMDYERGLKMLKDYVEDGKVHSAIEFKGNTTFDGCKYVGIKSSTTIDEMGPNMAEKMKILNEFIKENNIESSGEGLSIYHKWDAVKRETEFTTAIMVDNLPANLSRGLFTGEIPKLKVHTIGHKGAYEHLGNAWGTQYMMQRGKEFKHNKKIDPFEVYKNSPMNTDNPDELITEIHFAVK